MGRTLSTSVISPLITGASTLPWLGAGSGPIHMDNVACVGTESSLDQCAFDSHTSDCTHVEDASVRCTVTRKFSDLQLLRPIHIKNT